MLKKFFLALFVVFLVIASTLLERTLAFKSKQIKVQAVEQIPFGDSVIQRFAKALTFKTVSWEDSSKMDSSQFYAFHDFLKAGFPLMDSLLHRQYINKLSILYKWQGSNSNLKPILLMAHQDVVPVDTAKLNLWDEAPFAGKVSNGFVYGRGAQDVKCQLMALHEAAEYLLKQGYQPERTIYFAFGHDEEIGGANGAKKVAEYLEKQGVKLEFLVDEGGALLSDVVPGVKKPVAVIGTAEKGYVSFDLTVNQKGGHSSMPPKETAIGILSKAIAKLEDHPYPLRITGVSKQMFDYVGPEMDFPMKMAMANRWLFKRLIVNQLAKGNSSRATLHTTTAATIFKAGTKENVLPSTAMAVVNHRILPGQTIDELLQSDKEIINDDRLEIKQKGRFDANEASPIADVNSESFRIMQKTIGQVMPDVIVAPFLEIGGTDSKHYLKITDNVYRFQPIRMTGEDLERIHGNNERHELKNYKESINFFVRLIENATSR